MDKIAARVFGIYFVENSYYWFYVSLFAQFMKFKLIVITFFFKAVL